MRRSNTSVEEVAFIPEWSAFRLKGTLTVLVVGFRRLCQRHPNQQERHATHRSTTPREYVAVYWCETSAFDLLIPRRLQAWYGWCGGCAYE